MTWLGDKIRSVLFCLDEGTVATEKKYHLEEKVISEPIITFIKEVKLNPSRFEIYQGNVVYGPLSISFDYLIIDKILCRSFSFDISTVLGVACTEKRSLRVKDTFKKGNCSIKGGTLVWLTDVEKRELLSLFNYNKTRADNVQKAKTKRKQANQRRQMRKLYAS